MHSLAAGNLSGWRAVSLQQRSGLIRLCDVFYFGPATICRIVLLCSVCALSNEVLGLQWDVRAGAQPR